jgi:ABC-2 type transport system ATP-binding protein
MTSKNLPAIRCSGVSLRYPGQRTEALSGIDLTIEQNTICGLLGRNAAGKTSLMSLLAGYRLPTLGHVEIFGEDPYENPRIVPQVAFVYNQAVGNKWGGYYKGRELFKSAAIIRPNWDDDYAHQLAERFELPMKKQVVKLSQGQQAAFWCILGLATRAPLTIFDEAYLGMDAVWRKTFIDELLADFVKQPRTILFSTHYIAEMERLFSEAAIIDKGRVIVHDEVDALRTQGLTLENLFIQLTGSEGSNHGA